MSRDISDLNAKAKAMQFLTASDRSKKELIDRLTRAGFGPEETEEAVAYVSSFGYLDDRRYAQNLVRRRIHSKSRQQIFMELREKGIDQDTADEAWEEICREEEYDEERMVREAAAKRYPDGIPDDIREKRKLFAYLARRGFSYDIISHVISD